MADETNELLTLVGGDRAVAREILADFLKSDTDDRAGLAVAVAERRSDDIAHHAHRIKGAARAIGAHQHAANAGRIEVAAATGAELAPMVTALDRSAADVAGWSRLLV
jgi:HPt (histidine-containing phosphotransfer) domain-containing protein